MANHAFAEGRELMQMGTAPWPAAAAEAAEEDSCRLVTGRPGPCAKVTGSGAYLAVVDGLEEIPPEMLATLVAVATERLPRVWMRQDLAGEGAEGG